MFNLKTILTLITGIIIGICCCNLFSCNHSVISPTIATTTTTKTIEKQVQQNNSSISKQIDSVCKFIITSYTNTTH